MDRQARELLRNSYDNSILYLDYVADQIIRQLQQTKAIAAMWYISDHGEVLFDQDRPLSGHGHHSAYDHRPPALSGCRRNYSNGNLKHGNNYSGIVLLP